jgi:ATP-binding cassette subfamily B protein
LNDTLLLALLPAVVVLVAVAPAARLSNARETRLGGALADSVTCNAVVKSFGAESREDSRLHRVLHKWSAWTYRTWIFGTRSGTLQLIVLPGLRTFVALYALILWWRGVASLGDVAFALTSYLIVRGYLRDVGQHVANLQRSVNEMEELVRVKGEPLGVEDPAHVHPLRVAKGGIVFDRVTFRYSRHLTLLFSDFSLTASPPVRRYGRPHSDRWAGLPTAVRALPWLAPFLRTRQSWCWTRPPPAWNRSRRPQSRRRRGV